MNDLIDALDNLLPQTQCGLCGYGACKPYATALALNNESINLCPPGGVSTLTAIASLLKKDATPFLDDMANKTKPPSVAVIREDECIGCTKCIQACPVDAIMGSSKQMHTVISTECTGCELCVAPCPVDCIEMLPVLRSTENVQKQKSKLAKQRYESRQKRLQTYQEEQKIKHATAKKINDDEIIKARRIAIQEAVTRVKNKKSDNES